MGLITAKYAKYAKNGKIFNHKEPKDHREKLIFWPQSFVTQQFKIIHFREDLSEE